MRVGLCLKGYEQSFYFSLIPDFLRPMLKPLAPLPCMPCVILPKISGIKSSSTKPPRIAAKIGQEIDWATSGSTPPGLYFVCAVGTAAAAPATARLALRLGLVPSRNAEGDT